MMDISELRKLGEIDEEFSQHLKTNGMAPRPGSLEERRNLMHDRTIAAVGTTPSDLEEYEQPIPTSDGHNNIAIVVKRKGTSNHGPLVLLFFGGGFCSGEPKQMVPYGRGLARLYSAVVVCCDYRLAPEKIFPTSAEDAYTALEWCAHNAAELKADPSKGLVVGGVSAGGNLSGVITALSIERKLSPKVTGQWLSVPCFFDETTVPAEYKDKFICREQNAEVPGMSMDAVRGMLGLYKPDPSSPYYNPMYSKAQIKDLPPAVFQVDGMDPIRDDGLIYADILEKASVPTQLYVYPGQVHAHWTSYPEFKSSKKAMLDIMKGIGWLLGSELQKDEDIINKVGNAGAG